LIKDTIYFFLHPFGGGGEKHEDDNPMKYKGIYGSFGLKMGFMVYFEL